MSTFFQKQSSFIIKKHVLEFNGGINGSGSLRELAFRGVCGMPLRRCLKGLTCTPSRRSRAPFASFHFVVLMGEVHLFIGWGDLVPLGLINFPTERVFGGRSALPARAFLHAFPLESNFLRFIPLCDF